MDSTSLLRIHIILILQTTRRIIRRFKAILVFIAVHQQKYDSTPCIGKQKPSRSLKISL